MISIISRGPMSAISSQAACKTDIEELTEAILDLEGHIFDLQHELLTLQQSRINLLAEHIVLSL